MRKSSKLSLAAPDLIDLDQLKEAQLPAMFDAEALGQRAAAMLAHCDGLKKERVVKCILAGIFLAQVRAELGHGPFSNWLEKHLCNSCTNGSSRRTAYHYIGLAGAFSRHAKLLLPELIGANQLSLDLAAVQDEGGRTLLAKLDTFVGQRGLTELMHKHGVIKKGGAREEKPGTAPKELLCPPWANEREQALWATLGTERARLAFIDWRPRINQIFRQVSDIRSGFLADLDEQTKGDLIAAFTQTLGFIAPHTLKRAPKA